jgi:chemotaxis protein methyltransferase CheR
LRRGDGMTGPLPLSPQVFTILSTLLEERFGLYFGPEYLDLLSEKLGPRALERGFESLLDYYYFLRYDEGAADELAALPDVLTVNETYFMREAQQLRVLVSTWLEPAVRAGNVPRVWCAACSTGEEAISLAALLDERGLLERVHIVASDLSARALEVAARGRYGPRAARSLSPLPAWLRQEESGLYVDERLKRAIDWQRVNLLDAAQVKALATFDAISCRNVLIYFRDETIQTVINRLQAALLPGGALLVGASESLMRLGTSLVCEEHGGAFFYRKEGA